MNLYNRVDKIKQSTRKHVTLNKISFIRDYECVALGDILPRLVSIGIIRTCSNNSRGKQIHKSLISRMNLYNRVDKIKQSMGLHVTLGILSCAPNQIPTTQLQKPVVKDDEQQNHPNQFSVFTFPFTIFSVPSR